MKMSQLTMLTLSRIILLKLLALVACDSSINVVPESTYSKFWRFEDAQFGYPVNLVDRLDDGFLYKTCKELPSPYEVHCNITLETLTADKSVHKTTCPVKIEPNYRKSVPSNEGATFILQRLGKSRAILNWPELGESSFPRRNLKYAILDLTNCTIMRLPDFYAGVNRDKIMTINTIPYSHGFDIIVSERSACNGMRTCRLSYDEQGRQIGGPVAFNTSFQSAVVQSVAANSADKGFFLLESDKSNIKLQAEYVSTTGLKTQAITLFPYLRFTKCHFSAANDMLGICSYLLSGEAICSQFDASGKEKMTTPRFKIMQKFESLLMYNLAGGGMLLALPVCYENTYVCSSLHVIRINPDGSIDDERMNVIGLNLVCNEPLPRLFTTVSETSDKYCFHLACANMVNLSLDDSFAQFISHCIKKDRSMVI